MVGRTRFFSPVVFSLRIDFFAQPNRNVGPILVRLAMVVFLASLVLPSVWAQSQFATLSGTVTDSSGAIVVGAKVTIKPVDSPDARRTVTNAEGFFSVPALPVGKYEVTVESKGFKKWEATGVTLNASDNRAMKIELVIGAAQEVVTVEGTGTELAPVDSGEKSALVSSEDLDKLSLVGRNATEYLKILPGALLSANNGLNKLADSGEVVQMNASVASDAGGGLSTVNINGQTVDMTMDGQRVVDPGSTNLVPVNPNPDMISEVKVLTSNYTAENAKGPVVMNSTIKSGGNDFHGDLRFYARNTALNSTEHFNVQQKVTNPKPPSYYYYPGASLGGPILIPGTGFNKSRKKLFFFESFEYYKQQLDGGVERDYVPTQAMLNGDFSSLSSGNPLANAGDHKVLGVVPTAPAAGSSFGYDIRSAAGCTITAGVLSSGCISPAAQTYLKNVFPAPNADPATNSGFNYVQSYSVPQNSWQNMAKGDWVISDNTKVYVSWSRQRETNNWPVGLWVGTQDWWAPSPSPIVGNNSSDMVSGTFVHVFSPTMTVEARVGYMKESLVNTPTDINKFTRSGVGYPLTGHLIDSNIPAATSWGDSIPNLGEVGYDWNPNMVAYKGIPSGAFNLTKVLGTHTTKWGFYYEHAYNKQDNWQQYMGAYTYGSWTTITGNQYADMLMGIGQGGYFQQGPPQTIELGQNIASFYGQDDWKLTRRLSVQYGLRFEHYAKPYSPGFGLAIFDPNRYNPNAPAGENTGVSWNAVDPTVPLSGVSSRFLFFSPRVGAVYDLLGGGKTVLRGGWGKYRAYDSVQSRAYTDPAGTALGIVGWGSCGQNDKTCPTWESVDTTSQGNPPGITGAYKPTLGHPNLQNGTFTAVDPTNDEQPLVEAYSLSIDQALPARFKAEISYVGNHTQFAQGSANINAVPYGALFNASCNATNAACQQQYRPFQLYQTVTEVKTIGKARFDSLQASVFRTVGWLSLQGNYTFSKTMGEGNGLNGTNGLFTGALPDYGAKWLYGISSLNRAHMLSAAYVFSLPNSHSSSAFVRNLANDWQISGITQVASGPQLNVQNANFNASLPGNVAGGNVVNYYGTPDIQLYPLITCNPTSNLGKNQFLNPNCFTFPQKNQLGNAGMPYIPGPMFWNTDITLLKGIRLTERQRLEFRFAAFNPFNHALRSFNNGDNNLKVNFNDLGQVITGTTCPGTTNGAKCTQPSTFGVADAIFGRRKLEFGLKYMF